MLLIQIPTVSDICSFKLFYSIQILQFQVIEFWLLQIEKNGQLYFTCDNGETRFLDLIQLVDFHRLNKGSLPCPLLHECSSKWYFELCFLQSSVFACLPLRIFCVFTFKINYIVVFLLCIELLLQKKGVMRLKIAWGIRPFRCKAPKKAVNFKSDRSKKEVQRRLHVWTIS